MMGHDINGLYMAFAAAATGVPLYYVQTIQSSWGTLSQLDFRALRADVLGSDNGYR